MQIWTNQILGFACMSNKINYFIFQFGDHIFWTDWQTQRIEKADKHFGHNREVIKQFFEGLMDIEIVSPYKQTGM